MPNRVKDFATTASTPAGDDFLALDGTTNGSRKIAPANLLPSQTGNGGKFLTTDGSALSWGAAASNWSTKTSAYTAASGDRILADTSGGAFTITLPASPTAGAYVEINDPKKTWATNNLTVARNGSNIDSLAENLVCNVSSKIGLTYINATIGWEVDFIAELGGVAAAPAQVNDYNTPGTYTWTKPNGAKSVQVICWGAGGGGGGGSGGAVSTARCPGGGGGGGARIETAHVADLVPSSVTVTVGAGGTAGTAGSNGSGGNGGAGGNSSFGGLVVAGGGGGGKQGIIGTVSVGGGGGGVHAQGATGAGTDTVPGGGWAIQNINPYFGSGLRGGDGRGQGNGYQAEWGGGGGGGGSAAPGGGPFGGGSVYGGGGGAAGGGINSSNSTQNGGTGGRSGLYNSGSGSNANAGVYPSGDGGNGGSSTVAGSNGGSPAGGGGGGGGGTTNGTAGGTGGNGRVVVITYF